MVRFHVVFVSFLHFSLIFFLFLDASEESPYYVPYLRCTSLVGTLN